MTREDFILLSVTTTVLGFAACVLLGIVLPKLDAELSQGTDAGVSCVDVTDHGLSGTSTYRVCAPPEGR